MQSNANTYALIVPARFDSKRLPGKPLIVLKGLPMIVRTFRQCLKAQLNADCFVATDSSKIAEACHTYDLPYLLTPKCLTGTDRVAECINKLPHSHFINVQGDEPIFEPNDLIKLVKTSHKYPDRVLNGYCTINQKDDFLSPS